MPQPVHYLPIATTALALVFSTVLLRRYVNKGRPPHLLWWGLGGIAYGLGTFTEAYTTLFGWDPVVFRSWYIAGALLGGAPLAQGTVYLLLKRRTANLLSVALVAVIAFGATVVLLSPVTAPPVEEAHRLSGRALDWSWVRLVSPFVNVYALIFLVGGAIVSAVRFRRGGNRDRFHANVLIAVGALLPGIGGSFTRAGYVEVLYVTELLGLSLIFLGYHRSVRDRPAPPTEPGLPVGAAARDGHLLR